MKTVEQHPPERRSAHQNRPIQSRKKRNKKRNTTHSMRRYQHYITRPLYRLVEKF